VICWQVDVVDNAGAETVACIAFGIVVYVTVEPEDVEVVRVGDINKPIDAEPWGGGATEPATGKASLGLAGPEKVIPVERCSLH
jgi:hypothetical protein